MLMKIASVLAIGFGTGFVAATVYPGSPEPVTARYEIQVITYSGDFYIAGSGDNCRAAWEAARVPADWRDIACNRVN